MSVRMTKFLRNFLLVAACFGLAMISTAADAKTSNPRYASIVMDAETGMILHQRYPDKTLHPASLAKMMTLMVTFDQIQQGKLKLRDRVTISRRAESMVPSKLGLAAGSSIRVEDAIYALVTKSANDVAVALAERVGGTESGFARLMNAKAREIGMSRTHYRNASGLHDPQQVTTARDQAKLSRYLITKYPEFYHYFSTEQFTYRGNTYRNHNRLMKTYTGMDGLKTGYIAASGFNLAASAVRNNRRLIGVVFGGRTARSRNDHMKLLLDNGFSKINNIVLAQSVPLPGRKPDVDRSYKMALNQISPEAGDIADLDSDEYLKWADLNPILQSTIFSAMVGQGDYDPAVSKRLETGLLAISAVKGEEARANGAVQNTKTAQVQKASYGGAANSNKGMEEKSWAIQIGAFSSRVKTDKALQKAIKTLPSHLSDGIAIIVPLKTNKGWLFRGRVSGYSKSQAQQACRYIKDCITISPQAY